MENAAVVRTPFQKGHVHFYDYIESFPGLPVGETFEERKQRISREIKNQFIGGNKQKAAQYLRVRDCFLFPEKPYVEYCLKHKTGLTIPEAAKVLGIYKSH